jgi:Protein of unknown function (DUF4239)
LEYAPTAVLLLSIVLLSTALGVAGVALTQRLVPVQRRKPHNAAVGIIYGGLFILFGGIVGFTSFLVLNNYDDVRAMVQSEAADVSQIYLLAQRLPEPKRGEVQGLAESYARVAVEEEWPLMSQNRSSPRAQALADELRNAIQGYKPATSAQQSIYAQELSAVNELDNNRATRLLDMHPHLPLILWTALLGLAALILLVAWLVGIEDTSLHMVGVGAFAAGVALVLFTMAVLDRPFGTDARIGPQPFELVLHRIEGHGKQ